MTSAIGLRWRAMVIAELLGHLFHSIAEVIAEVIAEGLVFPYGLKTVSRNFPQEAL